MDATTQPRRMHDLTVEELLRTALTETEGLARRLERESATGKMDLVTGAYIGSIMSRIANAQMKLND
jgi:G:T-mismatch repair DNA endonuclease (very short patch repair protein)